MVDLPVDIIPSVLGEIYYSYKSSGVQDETPDYKTLLSCCLVNSTWNRPAQTLLFRSVFVTHSFLETFFKGPEVSQRHDSLLQNIRIIEISLPKLGITEDEFGDAILNALTRCHSLYELRTHSPGSESFTDPFILRLRQLAQSRTLPLRSLRINQFGVQSLRLHQLMSVLDTLEFLWIGSETARYPIPGHACNARLYELRLTRNPPPETFRWLLSSSLESLRILELRDAIGLEIKRILTPFCPNIRSLRLMTFNHISVDLLRMCVNLEELILLNIPGLFTFPPLPPSFYHLSIFNVTVVPEYTSLKTVINLVKKYPNLRSIYCNAKTTTIADYPELEETCRKHNVLLDTEAFNLNLWPHTTVLKSFSSTPRRGFAQATNEPISAEARQLTDASNTADGSWKKGKVPVREDHGLWGFFRRKADGSLKGEDAYETVEAPRKEISGRAWRASELRLKSFKDLHTLWYITLRERNLLVTQKEEARKAGITIPLQTHSAMAGHCRKTMARIKVIMNERRIAYEGAVKLVAEHQEVVQDRHLLKLQRAAFIKAHEKFDVFQTKGRNLARERRKQLLKVKKELAAEGVLPAAAEVEVTPKPVKEEPVAAAPSESVPEPAPAAPSTPPAQEASAIPTGTSPQTAADTAAAGLFGGPAQSQVQKK
ncbi:hypothetical protein EST38_g2976 [Candolleomyces aberdarensis]|uniref:Large ribosomal subunit protein uL29m n=1 Tax=Candolleomyces aberdarensis TaxID=2316362 RepID=A0A4Q2DT94_9AGAR|nr:hypothetical protein EST38_g2976 [Candolleomyces aberdarensis]